MMRSIVCRAQGLRFSAVRPLSTGSAESRIQELGISLPAPNAPKGNYRMTVRDGNLLYVSGHGPQQGDSFVFGRLGEDLEVDDGVEAARLVALSMLATVKAEAGSLDRVKRLVKTLGFVNCTSEFTEQVAVINGFSDTMAEVFGETAGVGVRSALGTNQLPFKIAVEVEAVFELHSE